MADIQQPDFNSLVEALKQGDQRGAAVRAATGSFNAASQSAEDAQLERRKAALANAIKQQELTRENTKVSETIRHNKAMEDILRQRAAAQATKGGAKATELKSKATLYAGQAKLAEPLIKQFEDSMTGRMARLDVPFVGTPERFKGQNRKRFEGASRRFAAAVLRPETGAQANEGEIKDVQLRLIPQPGDGPEVKAEKRQARTSYINLLEAAAKGDAEAGYKLDKLIGLPSTLARAAKYEAERGGQGVETTTGGTPLAFDTPEQVEAAGLEPGTEITVGGRRAVWE